MSIAVILNQDEHFLSAEWFPTSELAFSCLSNMIRDGWEVTDQGLVSCDERGSVVARPVKLRGSAKYTGVGIWRLSEFDVL